MASLAKSLAYALCAAWTASAAVTVLPECPPSVILDTSTIGATVTCLELPEGKHKVIEFNGTNLNLSNQNITAIRGIPNGTISLDLSYNSLQYVVNLGSTIQTLNLRGNRIVSLQNLNYPAGLQELDVSSNFIQYFGYDWTSLVNLTRLNISSNRLNQINKPLFPPTLKYLDLSSNLQIIMADLDIKTFRFLTSGQVNVSFEIDASYLKWVTSNCRDVGQLGVLDSSYICVFDESRENIQSDMFASLRRLTIISLTISVALVLGYIMLHWYRRRSGYAAETSTGLEGRATITSSACLAYDQEPIQYRRSISPTHIPPRQ